MAPASIVKSTVRALDEGEGLLRLSPTSVSYTHLTLPPIYSV